MVSMMPNVKVGHIGLFRDPETKEPVKYYFKMPADIAERDVIVVDPPRVGIKPDALDKIISYGVDQIVYISCNPKSLAENLYYFQYYGYNVVSVKPFDNFPGTKHVECVVLMSRVE